MIDREASIPFVDLRAQYHAIQNEIGPSLRRVLESGHFVLGEEAESLERELAAYTVLSDDEP